MRELKEETTLDGALGRLLWTGRHNGRHASYFLMTGVTGTLAVLRSWIVVGMTALKVLGGGRFVVPPTMWS